MVEKGQMAIEPLAKPKPRVVERAERVKAKTSKRREVYALVNRRDQYRCRACGLACDPSATDILKKGHHHHVRYRSRGGDDETANICILCAFCHAAVHRRDLGVSGNADSTLVFSGQCRTRDGHWEHAVS
jgi:5-methylcytosine-specific restriction endonuclease McrA